MGIIKNVYAFIIIIITPWSSSTQRCCCVVFVSCGYVWHTKLFSAHGFAKPGTFFYTIMNSVLLSRSCSRLPLSEVHILCQTKFRKTWKLYGMWLNLKTLLKCWKEDCREREETTKTDWFWHENSCARVNVLICSFLLHNFIKSVQFVFFCYSINSRACSTKAHAGTSIKFHSMWFDCALKAKAASNRSRKKEKNNTTNNNLFLFLSVHLPVVVSQSGWITKAFCKWIRIDFQFSYQLILISGYRSEYRFGKHERFVIKLLQLFRRMRYTFAGC